MTMETASGIRVTVNVGGGHAIPDKVVMVMSRPKIALNYREFSFTKIDTFLITVFYIALAEVSLAQLKIKKPWIHRKTQFVVYSLWGTRQ